MTLLLVHAAATWFMVGLIWVIQVVHYPLFRMVGEASFLDYERAHTRRMGAVLALPAVTEMTTAAALVFVRPESVGLELVLGAGALLAGIWIMTGLVQAPTHGRLAVGYDRALVDRLVTSNWWRTIGWTVRGALVAAMVLLEVSSPG